MKKGFLKPLLATGALVLLLASCSSSKTQIDDEQPVTAFTHVNLVPMTDERVIPNQTVLVEGRSIISVGSPDQVDIPMNAVVIDGAGAYLMPGLADMHVHSTDDWLNHDNWPVSPMDLFLANGVTTIRDCGHNGDIALPLRWRDEINAGRLDGPTLYTTGDVLYGDRRGPVYEGIVQEQQEQGFDFLKLYSGLSEAEFYGSMEAAKQLGMYTAGHIPYRVGLEGVLSAGMDEIVHLELLYFESLDLYTSDVSSEEAWLSRLIEATVQLFGTSAAGFDIAAVEKVHKEAISAVVAKLEPTGVGVGTTMIVDEVMIQKLLEPEAFLAHPENRYLPQSCLDAIRRGRDGHQVALRGVEDLALAKYAVDRLILMELGQARVPLLLGTDSGGYGLGVVPGFTVHDELRILTENGFTPYGAIATATINAASVLEAMNGAGDFGTIVVGNRADLILVNRNPLEDVANIRRPLGVMAAGRWYSSETLEQMMAMGD